MCYNYVKGNCNTRKGEENEKLNKVQAGFVPLTFKGPKAREKKTFDFDYEPTFEQMKYDVTVSDDDDFDI